MKREEVKVTSPSTVQACDIKVNTLTSNLHFSAAEAAEVVCRGNIEGYPRTEQGWRIYAKREGWDDLPEPYCRKRKGRGGGREYLHSLYPRVVRAAMEGDAKERQLTARFDLENETLRRQVEALKLAALPARAKAAMEARSDVLVTIDGFSLSNQHPRSWAIDKFLKAQKQYSQRIVLEKMRDAGQPLTNEEAVALGRPCLLTGPTGFDLSIKTLKTANDRRDGGMIKRSSLYAWFKAKGEDGVAALAPKASKEQQPIHEEFAAFLKFYAIPSKPSASDALGEYHKENPDSKLSIHQVRYTLRNRLNNIEKNIGREGMLTLRSRLPYVTRTTEDMWPTTIYTADGKTFDAEISDPVTWRPIRPEITTILDVVTRKAVGLGLSRKENTITVTESLRNACAWHGVPAIFYVDRGPGYKNKTFDAEVGGLMGRLGITKMHAAPYGSQAKGLIERPNATIWDVLAKRLPTYIGKDMDKEASKLVHKTTRKEIKEFGRSAMLPSWDEFVKLCEERLEEYNDTPHRGLPKFQDPKTKKYRHMSPNEAWDAHVAKGFEPVEISQDEVNDLFRPYELRVVRRGEVHWHTNSYFDIALRDYHGEKVMVGYDYHQADKVWVREFDVASGQPGPLICVAKFMANAQRYVPRSMEQEALETRAEAQITRLDERKRAVEEQRDGLTMIEHHEAPIVDLFVPETAEPELVSVTEAPRTSASGSMIFTSDEHLAAWALDHPDELTKDQIGILVDCMSRSTARELFRMSGIDTEALRNLLRAVA